jgi:hypothetical protein
MPRVVPSQVVDLIDQLFPSARTDDHLRVHLGATMALAAVIAFVNKIPAELLTITGQDLSDYAVALASIERVQQLWLAGGGQWNLADHRATSPIVLLRRALAKCPDEAPAPGTTELGFIIDVDLRDSIRRDISAANQDMVNGEWKGATVLAGSATEALLLWAVQDFERRKKGAIAGSVSALVSATTLSQRPNSNPARWVFIELIEIALHMGLITSAAAMQARLGKDFRNLIHPGRAARLGQVCDRATALSALAAVEHVVRDLTP